ncbi:Rib/alpha-like domain-containing protein, partial [Corynebacterium sp. HMSC29G08]|uniref:Rib/alpha-like domain-containing protein n=1 Tax=Corynebacterium sp. HMSC29G08 TaxID=1581069 RepID=UPI001AEFEB6E
MTARTTIRNRGISIAAAAVTAALIAPAVQPVSSPLLPAAHAQEAGDAPAQGGENAPAAPSLEDQPKIDSHGNPVIWADGVANGYVSSVSNMHLKDYVLSGRAWEINNVGLITGTGLPAVPAGTTIYMQWIDTDGSVSPYYAAKIHNAFRGAQGGEGTFAFDMRQPWVDTNGTQHQWSAEKGKSFRLWIPAYERDGVKYNMLRQADPFFPGAFVGNHSEGNGSTHYLDKNKQFLRVLMAQVPNVELMTRPRDEWEDGTITKGNEHVVLTGIRRERDYKDTVSGTVWNETGTRFDRTGNMSTGPNFTRKSGDRLHEGATVVFSKMTPEGYQKYDAAVNSLPEEQRTAAAVKFLKENPDAIAFTRYSKTNENGQFTIQLPSGAIPDGLRTTDAGFKDFRDIWMGVIDSNGDIVTSYSPWMVPQFHSPRAFVTMRPRDPGRNPINAPVVNSPETKGRNLKSVAFALLPGYDVNLRIINFNTTDKPASPGDVAELELTGKLPPLNSWIEWRDPQGKVLKGGAKGENLKDIDCLIVNGDMGDCRTFEVPKDAKAGTIYTAYLVNGTPGFDEQGRPRHNDIAADSFIVASMQNAEFDPAYEETRVKQGEEATIDAPKDKGGKELPKGTKFTAPEDVTEKIQG